MTNIILKVLIYAPPLLLSMVIHELMHGYVALRCGDMTAKAQGRLTLNPIKHIDPFMSILMPMAFIISGSGIVFGGAKPVPVNPLNFRNLKRDFGLTAVAGPATNFALALIAALLIRAFDLVPQIVMYLRDGYVVNPVPAMLFALLSINVGLVTFNLLPIPPLDGGRVMVSILPDKQSRALASIEPYGMFIILGMLFLDAKTHILGTLFGAVFSVFLSII